MRSRDIRGSFAADSRQTAYRKGWEYSGVEIQIAIFQAREVRATNALWVFCYSVCAYVCVFVIIIDAQEVKVSLIAFQYTLFRTVKGDDLVGNCKLEDFLTSER